MKPLPLNGQSNTDKDNTMAGKSVKVVAATSDAARANANIKESLRLHNVSLGTGDIRAHEEKRVSELPKGPAVKIRTNSGISGKGGANVGGVYKPMGMGSGMNWQTK